LKYWRGYLVAGIIAAITQALVSFAAGHTVLVDMLYPYMTRSILSVMASWSDGVSFCIWQMLLLLLIAGALISIVLMVVLRWNPIQWFGWIMAVVSVFSLLNTGIFTLNEYSGPITDDLRLDAAGNTGYTIAELEATARHYQDLANEFAKAVKRDEDKNVEPQDFQKQAQQASKGFEAMTYEHSAPIFAGSLAPVKQLSWQGLYTARDITGTTFPLTGEAAVNPDAPAAMIPFVMCREMARRMCIVNYQDAAFAAVLACEANPDPYFQYAGYFMAYRYCVEALEQTSSTAAQASLKRLRKTEGKLLSQDLAVFNDSFAADEAQRHAEENADRCDTADMLVNQYVTKYILPTQVEEENPFDPLDETQVDLSGLPNVR